MKIRRMCVEVPEHIGGDAINDLFTVVADAVYDWVPDDRDGWDPVVYAGPAEDPDYDQGDT